MTQPESDKEIQLQQTLDRLGIKPQQLFHHLTGAVAGAVSTSDLLEPKLQRAGDPFGEPLRNWRVNPDALNDRLQAKFFPVAPADPLTYGFCYKLTHQGRTLFKDRANSARVATPKLSMLGFTIPAVPRLPWDYDVRTNLCSVSKVVTAIAMDLLLRERDIDPDKAVGWFLPSYWDFGPGTAAATFHSLMRHEGGLGGSYIGAGAGDFAAARNEMGRNVSGPVGTTNYKNVNYTILRVTFPIVAGAIDREVSCGPAYDDALWDLISTTFYRDFVNDRIFAPAGLGPFDFKAGPDTAYAYGTPPKPPGARLGDVTNDAGSSGWHLSINELMKVMAEFRHGGTIMSRRKAQLVQQNLYGFYDYWATNAGTVYAKRGRYNDGGANTLDTAIYFIPGNFELGVFINSGPGTGVNQPSYNDDIMRLIVDSVESS
jgi:Beta-lactamase